MNTPSKEALDASEAVQDYLGFPRRATMDLAAIIDRHIEPLRQRAEQAEARVKELDELYRDLRVAYEQNASQCVQLNRELKIDTVEWLNGTAIQRDRAEKAEARVAELVAALRETLDDPNSTISGALYYRMEQVLARAESGVPDHIRDAAQMVSPAKHPDTEIIDRFEEMCGSLEYCDADEERNHWRAYGYSGSNEGVGRTMRDALRAAIDAARKEVQP